MADPGARGVAARNTGRHWGRAVAAVALIALAVPVGGVQARLQRPPRDSGPLGSPVLHVPLPETFACFVISSNLKLPLFKYNLLVEVLLEKNMSGKPSLLKSPMPTPAPLYKYS